MIKDYSATILGDFFKKFRKCCFCKLKESLSRVSVTAYEGTQWYYFHDRCLNSVLDEPEKFSKLIDLANEISNEILNYKNRNILKDQRENL